MSRPDAAPAPQRVSVVVCAFTERRWDDLCKAVASLGRQSVAPEEVVVVIDHNEALLERAQRTFSHATVVANLAEQGLSGARNTGMSVALGDTVLFLDDDASADPEWLREMTEPLVDPDVVGVGGYVLPAWDGGVEPAWFPEEFYWVVGCSYRGLPGDRQPIRNPIGAAMAFRAPSVRAAGGFSSTLGRIGDKPVGCEETDLSLRISAREPDRRVVLARTAVVHHRVPKDRQHLGYFLRRCYWEGVSKAVLARRIGDGGGPGLSSERTHALKTLPTGMLRAVVESLAERRPARALRAGAIVLGLAATVFGYASGTARKGTDVVQDGKEPVHA
ncbi:glycosyltransferase family 2 protein [Zafaria sp. Z1313]|uniref:glycosyltransferase family 2 protein n=1 Tax=Zafaria sp. Z1313 TaxID=3423202 RepID=UPI003D3021B1